MKFFYLALLLASDILVAQIPEICRNFRRGECYHPHCNFAHVARNCDAEFEFLKRYADPKIPLPEFCRDYLKNQCNHRDCRYFHITTEQANEIKNLYGPAEKTKSVCHDFLSRNCRRGPECRYLHVLPQDHQTRPIIHIPLPQKTPPNPSDLEILRQTMPLTVENIERLDRILQNRLTQNPQNLIDSESSE